MQRNSQKGFSTDDLARLARFLDDQGFAAAESNTIPRQAPAASYPLAFAQKRLWFLDQFVPHNPAYNLQVALRLRGRLDTAALERSLAAIVARHAGLRTSFSTQAGEPVQVVAPAVALPLVVIDLRAEPIEAREQCARARIEAELNAPFDLTQPPLLRARLLRLDDHDHILLLTLHHIIFDGWSVAVFYRELAEYYAAERAGRAAMPAPLPIQYVDYACWQRMQQTALSEQLAYWKEHLSDAPALLELPTDRPRPPIQTYNGALQPLTIGRPAMAALTALCRQENATLFMALLAAFQLLLARYSGQDDIVIGTPVAGRTRAETNALIGCFINTLVLRGDLSGNPSFRALLARTRELSLDAFTRQDVPFEMIVEELNLERSAGYTPLFQVMFALHNVADAAPELPDLNVSVFNVVNNGAKFDLLLELREVAGELQGDLLYNTDLFDSATIARMAEHFVGLVEQLAAQPERPVRLIPLATAQEQRRLLGSATPAATAHETLSTRFEAQVARTPGAIALTWADTHLTYLELDQRANRLAHHLRALGVGPDTLVALYLDRGLDLVVALLATLKAGGAYLPIDPAYPPERISFMLADAKPIALIINEIRDWRLEISGSEQSLISNLQSPTIISLDADWPTIAQQPTSSPHTSTAPGNLAYVIYTSGSTGRPKGVLVTHANVLRLFDRTWPWFQFNEQDVWTLFHSAAFDFSVWEIWGALLYGGRLVVVPYLVSREPEAFARLLRTEAVTVLNQTPSAFRQLMETVLSTDAGPLALRFVIFGGEALEPQMLRPWFERYGDTCPLMVNMYGITETTVHVTYRPIRAADLATVPGSVIGVPISDLGLYVLDQYLQPAPIGVPGELYVGGGGVARGYLNRPELTAERFIPDPFATTTENQEPRTTQRVPDREWMAGNGSPAHPLTPSPAQGGRLYRTGDLARLLAYGELQYLGRADHQVKMRGFRIELGEIEAALLQHPAVHDVVVVAHTDEADHKRLVAYVVPAQEQRTENKEQKVENGTVDTSESPSSILHSRSSNQGELRAFLKQRLPEYMVPAVFVVLDKLPLTPSGKLDRRGLPAPQAAQPIAGEAYVAPRNPIEALLAQVWMEALKLPAAGIHDNFFALGGDSLVSVQVLALARSRGMQFSLQDLFRYQTIAGLAPHVILREGSGAVPEHAVPFSMIAEEDRQRLPAGIEDAYPLTLLQAGMVYHMHLNPEAPDYHNVDSYHYRGICDIELFRQALASIVARHPILRTSFDLSRYSQPLQLVHRHVHCDIGMEDLRHLAREEQEQVIFRYIESERKHLFDLSRPPLLRFQIHRRSDETFQWTLTECHAILDGWSLGTLSAELFTCYAGLIEHGSIPELPSLTSTFRDFVLQERLALQSAGHRRFWAEQLAGASLMRLPRWPLSYRRRENQPARVTWSIAIDAELERQLHDLARAEAVPLKTVLLAAHLKVLSLLSDQTDIVTGYASHGRLEETGSERVCGLFLNPLPFRGQLTGGTWRDLIRATFATECELLPYRTYPQAAIQQDWSGGERLFETLFNYTHFRPMADLLRLSQIETLEVMFASEPTNIPLLASFYLDPVSARITFFVQHDTSILCDEQAEMIRGYYLAALAAMAGTPGERYETADLLSRAERERLLASYNATATDYPRDRCIHELFAAQAEARPDVIAAVFGDHHLTYGELQRRSDQLAQRLKAAGIAPEARVGIYAERSPELIIGMLGILKAGGAYVPLDSTHPPERLSYMLQDASASALICHQRLADALPSFSGLVVPFEGELPDVGLVDLSAPAIPADRLAYVMYTSGSTGTPKGIGIPHQAIVRLVSNTNYIEVAPDDRIAQASNSSFDAATFEIWGALAHGARIVGVEQDALLNPARLAEQIRAMGISVLFVTTALFNQLARAVPDIFAPLGTVLFGGEAVDPRWVAQVLETGAPKRLLHVYGPTESTTFATWHHIRAVSPDATTIPIGGPLANTQTYVLDRHGLPVPPGVPGELYIGGDGLARGYLGRPDLTADRFIPNPFTPTTDDRRPTTDDRGTETDSPAHPLTRSPAQAGGQWSVVGGRLYRTGDIVCLQPDGAIEFIGRRDQQVKLRGFRIEMGEIESVLVRHPQIQDAVVIIDADTSLDKRLVAYVVWREPQRLDLPDVQRFLADRLPAYMVPAAFVPLDVFPLNPNGKVDRRALPSPATAIAVHQGFVAPRTEVEETLVGLWAQELGLERVSTADNFFALGGNSLALMRLSLRVRDTFQVDIPLRGFFEASSAAEMAAMIDEHLAARDNQGTESIESIERIYHDDDLLPPLDQLSDEDVDALLRESLGEARGIE